ncbi:MAG TPA: endolytic transglycosylase MltG [bacterium]|nr:endolytic transglycosylase MltG [bacterium]
MKILKIYGYVFLVLCLAGTFLFVPTFFFPGPESDVPVYSKTTARQIAQSLEEKGIIHFPVLFRALAKFTHADRKLKAGLYRLNPRMSLWQVLSILAEGRSQLLALKVPEGYTVEQIGRELERMKVMPMTDFVAAAEDKELLKALGIPGPSAEGYLFPETYRVPVGASAQALVELMVRQFFDSVGADFEPKARAKGLSPYQAVILASIVEKETGRAEERPLVAAVLYNRLHQKIRLEVNATLNYILSDKRAWLTHEQLGTQSPYNTYQHRGLPPTPICNPGLAALQATLDPAEVPYLFYVAKGDGTQLFSSTLAEHDRNVALAKRIRHQQRLKKKLEGSQ